MSDRLLGQIVQNLRQELDKKAHGAMLFPSADLLHYGIAVGNYQGLQAALEVIEGVLDEDAERDRKL